MRKAASVLVLLIASLIWLIPVPAGAEQDGGKSLSCTDIDPGWRQLSLTGHPISGTYVLSDGERTAEVVVYDSPEGGKLVNWKADGPVEAVLLASGQDTAVYEYDPAATSGFGLTPPLHDREGRNLAAVAICYDPFQRSMEIDLRLADTTDPVALGEVFDYVVTAELTAPATDAEVTITVPAAVLSVTDLACEIVDSNTVRCLPDLVNSNVWATDVTVRATTAGDLVASAVLRARFGEETIEADAVEVTTVLGGHGGDCGDDEDDEECAGGGGAGGGGVDLGAVCRSVSPDASTIILQGPFASRRYFAEGEHGAEVWVTVSETSSNQQASWSSNVPMDAVLARTGQDVEIYLYEGFVTSGSGITAPPGSGGGPRPMADMAFCYRLAQEIGLALTVSTSPSLVSGSDSALTVVVAHRGYVDAQRLELTLTSSEHLVISPCRTQDEEGRCDLGPLLAGRTRQVELRLSALEPGPAWISVEAIAIGDDGRAAGMATQTLVLQVAATGPVGPIVTTPVEKGQLPFTGPGDLEAQALVAAAMVLVGLVGLGLARKRP